MHIDDFTATVTCIFMPGMKNTCDVLRNIKIKMFSKYVV